MVDLMYLLDTNIFLELLLNQEKAGEVRDFFGRISLSEITISDFSLYSIGILLIRQKRFTVYRQFLKDVVFDGGITVVSNSEESLVDIAEVSEQYGLDFDDAYQYVVAKNHELQIVSFDTHFDSTDLGRKTPGQVFP